MSMEVCYRDGGGLHPSTTPSWQGTKKQAFQSWKFCRTGNILVSSSNYFVIYHSKTSYFSFDIGRILAQRATPIGPEQNLRELTDVMATIGAELMLDVLSDLDNHYAEAWTQDEANVTYGKSNSVFSTQDNKLKNRNVLVLEPLAKPLLIC